MKLTDLTVIAATAALVTIVATNPAAAYTCKNEYKSVGGLTIMTSSVCGTALDHANGTATAASSSHLKHANQYAMKSKSEKTDEQKAQIALNSEYRATRRELEAYYNKYDLDTGLIDTEVQAGIDAALAGDLELAYDLSVEFWREHMINPEKNVWEREDYKATEPLTAKLAELQAQGAEH